MRRTAKLSALVLAAAPVLAVLHLAVPCLADGPAGPGARAAPQTNSPSATGGGGVGEALSPDVQSAIASLSADDFKTRQDAVKKLEIALGEQMRALVVSDDPETQARLTVLLHFNEGLTRWVLETYKLPDNQRKAELNFGLDPDILPIMGEIFSSEAAQRVQGIHDLAKLKKPGKTAEITALLGQMLDDPDRQVYIAAMEAIWDRAPNEAIVNALWERAVEAGFSAYRGRVTAQPAVEFRGRRIPGANFVDNSYLQRGQDSGVACEVLVHLQTPLVKTKVQAFLKEFEKVADGTATNVNIWMYTSNSEPMKNAFRLIEAYKSKETVGILVKIASAPARQKSQGQMNTEKYFWSNRTTALATLIMLIGQKPEDYDLKRQQFLGGMWAFHTEEDEDKAIKKVQAWWTANGDKFDAAGKAASTQSAKPAASQPAPDDAAANTPPAPPGPAHLPMLQVNNRRVQPAPGVPPVNH